jgi:threonine dehydrogenase-like Zn-dependent dehydrogenase
MVFSKATFASAFVSLLACVAAVDVPKTDYDVIVVGGGPAGLSALSGVSRVRRTALLIDSQQYRNDPTREMHDVIGNDGEKWPLIPLALWKLCSPCLVRHSTRCFQGSRA